MSRTRPRRGGPAGTGGPGRRHPLLPGDGPLARVHPAVAFGAVLLVFTMGVWWGGAPGALVLGLLALGVGLLLAATWSRLGPPDRAVRLLVLVALVAIALHRWT